MLLKLTTITVAFLVWAPVASAWSWPVKGPVLQPFSYDEAHPYDVGQHRGIDIGASASGDPVVAPEAGTVSFAGFVPTSGESLTIETADGYSVTLTHLGSLGVAKGAAVSEGDVVATVGSSGTPEQSGPYVHLGMRLTADPLGYLDPVGFLPAPETPTATPTPTPTPEPQPVSNAVPEPAHARGGGLYVKQPAPAPLVAVPTTEPLRASEPHPKPTRKPEPKPAPAPAAHPIRADVAEVRWPVVEPAATDVPVSARPSVHTIEIEPLVLSVAPGVFAALLALVTAFTLSRRPAPSTARVIAFRTQQPLRRAA